MAQITLTDVTVGFGGLPLLEGAHLRVEDGERLCVVGRNGTGKTTLLRLLHGALPCDEGSIWRRPGLRTALLPQDVPGNLGGRVSGVVSSGLPDEGILLARYQELAATIAHNADPMLLKELDAIQAELDATDAWSAHERVERLLSELGVAPSARFEELSGGQKRRVLLARALAGTPDLLLLDEPTNHLDVHSITWLEEFCTRFDGALVMVSHDRMLMRRVATRMIDIDRGGLTSYSYGFDEYLDRKAAALDVEEKQREEFDRKLAREEVWVRQGLKARRTRNMGRVRALQELRAQRAARRAQQGGVTLRLDDRRRSGNMVARAKDIAFAWDGDRPLFSGFSTRILRKDRIGVLGPNGAGKTTLLRVLIGELDPSAGTVRLGTGLQTIYFDQLREELDLEKRVVDAVADGREVVIVDGRPKHVLAYLGDFLFSPERARTPVSALSGGERNRLLLARLFAQPANVLVLDEPTNDLDVETLEILEELLHRFKGTVLLVSHDREFLNNVVTSTLVFEGSDKVVEYAGGYDDWLAQRSPPVAAAAAPQAKDRKTRRKAPAPRKLTFKERGELEKLEEEIPALEEEKESFFNALADPTFYQTHGDRVAKTRGRIAAIEERLETAYARWQELEEIKESSGR